MGSISTTAPDSASIRQSTRRRPRLSVLLLAPVLAVIALTAWSLASPVGASPDDDFHLTSIWCANVIGAATCQPGNTAGSRVVPKAFVGNPCFVRQPETSAQCEATVVAANSSVVAQTDRGNFVGGYPPVYYATMSAFVGPDIATSVVVMRVVNVLLFVGLTTALFVFMPRRRRPVLVWGWLASTVPLGLFIIASNNPSSWAVTGVGTSWIALLAWFESSGRRKIALGAIFAIAVLMAAGSRSDGAIYAGLGIAVVLGLTFQPARKFFLDAILPAVLAVVCLAFFVTAGQSLSAVNGFGHEAATGGVPTGTSGLLIDNILNVPSLWAGVFGSWELGWLDTAMPAIVAFGSLACFVAVGVVGFRSLGRRKAIALAVVVLLLWVIPVYVLTKSGDAVGNQVQPRYLLPLIVLFAGLLVMQGGARPFRFTRGQLILVVATLSVVQAIALHTNMRRYVTGLDQQGFNLNTNAEWWWNIAISPMAVMIIGSVAYAGLLAILARHLSGKRADVEPSRESLPVLSAPATPIS